MVKTTAPFVAAVLLASNAAAASLFSYNGSQIATARADGPFVVGNLFRVDQTGGVQVTHLGIQDADAASDPQDVDGADGLTGFADDDGFFRDTFGGGAPLDVGLWSADGSTLLASATVKSTDPVTGSYRYATLASPVTLTEGTSYLIGAAVGGGIEWFLDGSPSAFSASSGITMLGNRYAVGGSLAAPVNDGGNNLGRWAPANAQFTPIPEPSALLAGTGALLGLAVRRRRIQDL